MTVFQLDDLGTLCGLMPDTAPSETELQTVCMLLSGIGKTQGDGQWNLFYKSVEIATFSVHKKKQLLDIIVRMVAVVVTAAVKMTVTVAEWQW